MAYKMKKLDISSDLFFLSCNVALEPTVQHLFFQGKQLNFVTKRKKRSLSITAVNTSVYIKASAAIPTSPVQMCLCDISFRSAALLQIIHSLDMSHTETKLYLLLNRISDGAALLENCMLYV